MADKLMYVETYTAPLYAQATGSKRRIELLWGDRVLVLDASGARTRVRARGVEGYVDPSNLGTRSLLEVYFIDVGQGDGVLVRTPDHRHIVIDGGHTRTKQQTGKSAADFIDWTFVKDVSASAVTGHVHVEADELRTPLVYSTEISRSFRVGRMDTLTLDGKLLDATALTTAKARVGYKEVNAGDLKPASGSRSLAGSYVVTGIVYGLVNVRTDGRRVLCAAMNEKNHTWDWAVFESRF